MKHLFIALLIISSHLVLMAQNSVSIGTEEINDNAVLQLVSQNNNQGFLVPRVNTVQREAMQLNANDNGMLVFDIEYFSFYYWHSGNWFPLISSEDVSIQGAGATQVFGTFPDILIYSSDGDTLANNEIQNLSNVLSQGNSAGNLTITGLANPLNNSDATTMEYVDNQISGTWSISGNDNIAAGNYIGTANNQDLKLRTNNTDRIVIDGVDGNVNVTNNVNVDGEYLYNSPRTRYISYSPVALNVTGDKFIEDGGYLVRDFSEGFIPIYLPAGAILVQVEFRVWDNSPVNDLTVALRWKNTLQQQDQPALDSWSSSGTLEGQQAVLDNINRLVLNNQSYWIEISCDVSDFQLGFYGARITYTVLQAD